MITFSELGIDVIDVIILTTVSFGSYFLTNWLFSKYITFAEIKGWTGIDIHKTSNPKVVESGGIVFLIGILPSLIISLFLFPALQNEITVFIITVFVSGFIGFIDDRRRLSSIKKIIFMIITGLPMFFLNLDFIGFIHIDNPIFPVLGQVRLSLIYPLVIPLIITILTNAVNMLEGYNGEGSGTSFTVVIFLLICAIISSSSEGLIFSLAILGALAAFYKFNKFPAKVFPGDVGTLALGASIACIGIFGSLEIAMFCAIMVHIFNGFYVISSVRGFKESHSIKVKDIYLSAGDLINASIDKNAPLTLPRLILAENPLKEEELVKNFLALAIVGGLFSIISEIFKIWTMESLELHWIIIALSICIAVYILIIVKFKAIRGITYFMIVFLLIGLGLLYLIDKLVILSEWNWLISAIIVGIVLFCWYILSIKYFWFKISKHKDRE